MLCGSGDVVGGGWDVEVVGDLGEKVGAALLEQGQALSQSAEVAVEGGVPDVRRVGLGCGIAHSPTDVAFDHTDDFRAPRRRAIAGWCHGVPSVALGRQIS